MARKKNPEKHKNGKHTRMVVRIASASTHSFRLNYQSLMAIQLSNQREVVNEILPVRNFG